MEKGGNVAAFLEQGISNTKVAWGRTWKSVSHTRWEPMVHHLLGGVWNPHIPGASVTKCGAAWEGGVLY